ncbi:hypothetical protein [Streptomyces venezuelae]|uniref:Uncharacterized protein n=1 Tax=Streptomyces venezuelae TaxID=54571 RepID=A0A5P2C1A6_STRVZ|nr:hypothetical protein [Streptomyces venezuelae]QES36313.1 hypothetical protein DEJ48_25515 [Streptomyces venezuelae]
METRTAFSRSEKSIKAYVVLSACALVAVVAVASAGQPVNTFMWVRAVLLPAVAVLMHRMTVAAVRGSRRAAERVRALAVVMPVAIVGVDLIPGVCPPWYTAAQIVCMLPVVRVAFLTRTAAPCAEHG